ncbi:hypothetical protein Poly30_01130 [Planctomycetes bacterium Poly30]|uniref:Uncharacterized protein n=1 Tax=Saltatorellus ferox TaxID=2528018 RepID=A0A518EKK5_9BACT|nr:hypothetical protein Poly30_01130 [Planctomycetes bacterium Poly30]
MTNPYCHVLGIKVPRLEEVKDHRDASAYSMLIVSLLEKGEGMTLQEVADRLVKAGFASPERALMGLKRCRPARPPVYRDGDLYLLDPHDDELDLWAFRLGLRPAKVPKMSLVRSEPEPIRGPDEPLTVAELEEAWRDAYMGGAWSNQRIALAILDALGGPRSPEEVIAFADTHCQRHHLKAESAQYWRSGAPIAADSDGRWVMDPAHAALASARKAVRERLVVVRRQAGSRPDPVVMAAQREALERQMVAKGEELARLRRVIVHAFPPDAPRAVVLLDVGKRELTTLLEDDLDRVPGMLTEFDVLIGLDIRRQLRDLGFDPEDRRLTDLGQTQKSMRLNKQGRTLKITTKMLIQSSCGISSPLGDPKKLRGYLASGATTSLRRRLESDAKALYAFYRYGRLQGAVRLKWGFLDEGLPVPWIQREEEQERLYGIVQRAHDEGQALEVVVGSAPGWEEPWARARMVWPRPSTHPYRGLEIVDEFGYRIDEHLVQSARRVMGHSSNPRAE